MKISEKVDALLKSIELTTDDAKSFEGRASFAQRAEENIDKVFVMVDTDIKTINGRKGELEFTVLKFALESNASVTAKCTIAFDFQNIFLTGDDKTSLKQLGEAKGGMDAVKLLGMFKVDKVTAKGIYPMKYSKAAQDLGYVIGKTYTDENYSALRSKYRDDAMKVGRTDADDDISWLEIKHIFVTPKE